MLESEKKSDERKKEKTLCESFCYITLVWCIQHSSVIGRCYSCCCHRLNGWCVSFQVGFFLIFASCCLSLTRFHLSFCCSRYCCCCCAVAMCVCVCVRVWFLHKRQLPWSPSMKRALTLILVCAFANACSNEQNCCRVVFVYFLLLLHTIIVVHASSPLLLRCALRIASDRSANFSVVMNFLSIFIALHLGLYH